MLRSLSIVSALVFVVGCVPTATTETAAAIDVPEGAPLYSPDPAVGEAAVSSGTVPSDRGASSASGTASGDRFDPLAAAEAREEKAAALDPDLLTFKVLSSFKYTEPDPGKPETLDKAQIPTEIHELHGQSVTMEGYMIPIDLDADTNRVKTFFLARSHLSCCFGQLPEVNEVVEVRFEDGVKYLPEILLRVEGKFEVGEEFDEYGYLMSIYRMEGTKLEDPWDK